MIKKLIVLCFVFSTGCSVDSIFSPEYTLVERPGAELGSSEYTVLGKHYQVLADSKGYQEQGNASWYGNKFHGRKTANGEVFNMYAMTAAHKTLPFLTYVKVTNLDNQRSVIVKINDRGPFHNDRIIDLSYLAAVKLDIEQEGIALVEVAALDESAAKSEPDIEKAPEAEAETSSEPETISEPEKSSESEISSELIAPETKKQQTEAAVYIQVGSFSSEFNAQKLQERLISSQIDNSRLQIHYRQGNPLYRVQIGPLNSVTQTDKMNKKLAAMGLIDTRLVNDK